MALRNILTQGDEQLLKHSRKVEKFDARLHTLIDDMRETLENSGGVGLAAPQVGVLRRVVVLLDINKDPEEVVELVNPEVIEQRGEQRIIEGCLSVPGVNLQHHHCLNHQLKHHQPLHEQSYQLTYHLQRLQHLHFV